MLPRPSTSVAQLPFSGTVEDSRRSAFQDNRHTRPVRCTVGIPPQGPDAGGVRRGGPELHLQVAIAVGIRQDGAVPGEAACCCAGGGSAVAVDETGLLERARGRDDVKLRPSDGG
jgi:hypothetical protein